jgi:farnesyl diphosphate synthase
LSFEARLRRVAAETEAILEEALAKAASPAARLTEAMRYGTVGQGKRLRPFLVVESAALFEVERGQALRVAAALESVHCYSLVHDDLPAMDDDDLRRGRPSLHRAFDEATAILAGDGLLTLAFALLADRATHPSAGVRIDLVSALARAAGMAGMVGGQMLDIEAEMAAHSELADIELIQSHKTGALFAFACEAGAILAEADPGPLQRYARKIGLAFQIADDVLDVESTAEALGKATQKDRRKGKATFVDLLGLEGAKRRAEGLVNEAIAELDCYGSRASMLAEAAQFMVNRRR